MVALFSVGRLHRRNSGTRKKGKTTTRNEKKLLSLFVIGICYTLSEVEFQFDPFCMAGASIYSV